MMTVLPIFGKCADVNDDAYNDHYDDHNYGMMNGHHESYGGTGGTNDLEEEKEEPIIPFTLDISDPDLSKTTLFNGTDDGIAYRQFFSKTGFQISSVTDDGVPVWTAGPEIDYVTVLIFSDDNYVILVVEMDLDSNDVSTYFQKVNGEWKEISETEYDDLIDEMMEQAEEYATGA